MEIVYTFVEGETTFTIEIERTHPLIDERIEQDAADRWVILTAENPWGEEFPKFVNKQRSQTLRSALTMSTWNWLEGVAKVEGYPEETVFLVWNIALEEAVLMSNQFEQSAMVTGVTRGYAEVVSLDTTGSAQ